jgi:hypothetical protein
VPNTSPKSAFWKGLLAARAVLLLEPMPLPRKDGGEGSKLDPDFPEPW